MAARSSAIELSAQADAEREDGYPTADAFELSQRTGRSTQARVTRVRGLLDRAAHESARGEDALVRVGDVRRELGSDSDVPPRRRSRATREG
jgi:hypothetical protein